MEHEVLKRFRDKKSLVFYSPREFYISEDYDRVMYLDKKGFIKANPNAITLKKEEKEKPKRSPRTKDGE